MNVLIQYAIVGVALAVFELIYFRVADKCNIIDKPNERSSHTNVVLRGGGVIFSIAVIVWAIWKISCGETQEVMGSLPFIIGLLLIAGVSFVDDIISLPDSVRLVAQFVAMVLMIWNIGMLQWDLWWIVPVALIVCVGAMNVINFMDGVNGMTAAYAASVLLSLMAVNDSWLNAADSALAGFIDQSLLAAVLLSVLVFSFFNFRPKGKAKCFAGDVGSIGIGFIMLFAIGRLIIKSGDATWLVFLSVYGVDGCCTILHRIMLHESLGVAHRKHAYQIMANELGLNHTSVSLIYMAMQLIISCLFIYVVPNTPGAHWLYLLAVLVALCVAYILFMRKYYHLHVEYLATIKR